jgi:fatty-acyl-CoA synthase
MRLKHLSYVAGPGKGLLGNTIGDALRETAKKHPRDLAAIFEAEKVRWTYAELLERCELIAESFVALGMGKGSRVGIYAPNCKEWVLTQFAASMADLILVNINPAYQLRDLQYALQKVECESLVMFPQFKSSNYVELIRTICPEIQDCKFGELKSSALPSLKNLVLIGDKSSSGMLKFDELYNLKAHDDYLSRTRNVNFEDPTNIQFTSGTTGFPKGATLTHHNILNNGYYIGDALKYTTRDKVCIQVPLYHCFGMVLGNLACITHGATMVFPDFGFNPAASMDVIEKEKCTSLYGVPTMLQANINEQYKRKRDVGSLRTGIVAGSLCTPELMRRVVDDLNIQEMSNCYGMTETSPVSFQTALSAHFDKRINTVGQVHPHVEAKLVDKSGHTVERGEIGEVCIRGYLVMKEYWKDEKATRKSIDSNGWMHTGDLGVMDEDGFLRIVGRIKDMIIRGGENVYPSEIEKFLIEHPDIEDVQVIGIPNDFYGEEICAWIKMKPGKQPLNLQDVHSYAYVKIAHYKIPRVIKIVDSYPTTITGKVMKYVMRAEYVENKEY